MDAGRTEAVMEMAQKAWEDYVFPDGLSVEGADGWEYEIPFVGDVLVSRAFYVGSDGQEADSVKCRFSVIVDAEAMALKEAYASDSQGNDLGSAGPEASPAP